MLVAAWGLVLAMLPAPGAGAVTSPSTPLKVLVVGGLENYRLLMTDVSLARATQALQVTLGQPLVDGYDPAQLGQYSVVYLYGFDANDPLTASGLLSSFVRRGGRLVVDVEGDARLTNQLALGAPGLFPATDWIPSTVSKRWGLRITSVTITRGLVPSSFSPPVYQRRLGWGVAVAHTVNRGGTVVVTCSAGTIVVTGRTGRGTSVMSGMNLTYHAASFQNRREAELVVRMLGGP